MPYLKITFVIWNIDIDIWVSFSKDCFNTTDSDILGEIDYTSNTTAEHPNTSTNQPSCATKRTADHIPETIERFATSIDKTSIDIIPGDSYVTTLFSILGHIYPNKRTTDAVGIWNRFTIYKGKTAIFQIACSYQRFCLTFAIDVYPFLYNRRNHVEGYSGDVNCFRNDIAVTNSIVGFAYSSACQTSRTCDSVSYSTTKSATKGTNGFFILIYKTLIKVTFRDEHLPITIVNGFIDVHD